MIVELDRVDILNLVHFVSPSFALQQTEEMLELGRYSSVGWIWNDKIKAMTNIQLYSLYQQCKTTK